MLTVGLTGNEKGCWVMAGKTGESKAIGVYILCIVQWTELTISRAMCRHPFLLLVDDT